MHNLAMQTMHSGGPAAQLQLDAPLEVARWRPLFAWLVGIPHLIIAGALQYAAEAVSVISWFAIVFTGKLPEGLANFQCLVLRYQTRAYSYAGFLREPYPAFAFPSGPTDPGDDPIRVTIRAQLEGRNRLTVALRIIWLIPAALFGIVVVIGLYLAMIGGFFAVLVTGRWPEGLRSFVIRASRWSLHFNAYGLLLTDEYPPFSLED